MFKPKKTKANGNMIYKTIYINEKVVKDIEHYANKSSISSNAMIVQMIEHCLNELKNTDK